MKPLFPVPARFIYRHPNLTYRTQGCVESSHGSDAPELRPTSCICISGHELCIESLECFKLPSHSAWHSYPANLNCPIIYHKNLICILGSVKVPGAWKAQSQCLVYSRPHLQILKNCYFTMKIREFYQLFGFFTDINFLYVFFPIQFSILHELMHLVI